MKKKLIITAHDVGISHSMNTGIIYALNHPDNIFTELSLLPNAPGSKEAAHMLRKVTIPINLCCVFTKFRPILKTHKTLTDKQGVFLKANTDTWDFSCIDSYADNEIKKELDAQWNWFIDNVGKKPSALTTQKGEHGDPKILLPFVEKAKKENVPIRAPYWKWQSNYAAHSFVNEEGVKHTDNIIIGISDWRGRFGMDIETDIDKIIETIEKKNGITELFIFCGFVDEELFNMTSVSWQRGQYLHILNYKPEILRTIKKRFDLISYKDL